MDWLSSSQSADTSASRRSKGQSRTASSGVIRGAAGPSSAASASAAASCPGAAARMTPRGVSSGCAANPVGGAAKNASDARERARIGGGP